MTKLTKKQQETIKVMEKYGSLSVNKSISYSEYRTLSSLEGKGVVRSKSLGNDYFEFSLI